MNITLEEIADKIDELYQLEDTPDSSEIRKWTKLIFKTFSEMIPDKNTLIPYNKLLSGDERGEYLIDYVWSIEEGKEWEDYKGLFLAMECEWEGREEKVWEDFVKLADVRSEIKVFVGSFGKWGKVDSFVESLARFIRTHRHTSDGEKYLIILDKKGGDDYGAWILDGCGHVKQYYKKRYEW